jgi:hypothetical protein
MSRWFRHYAGLCRDDKLVSAAIKAKQPVERVVWIWAAILESAAEIDDAGRFEFDPAEAAYFLRSGEDDILAVVSALEHGGRVVAGHVVNWGRRQFASDRSKERVAAHRERKRAETVQHEDAPTSRNGVVTLQPCYGNAPETETDTKTEKKEREESRADAAQPLAPVKKSHSSEDLAKLRFKALGVPDDLLADFIRLRKAKKLPLTDTAALGLIDKFQQAGMTETEGIRTCIERGWGGFNPEWLKDKTPLRIVANGPRY